jgi:hypothetical protein
MRRRTPASLPGPLRLAFEPWAPRGDLNRRATFARACCHTLSGKMGCTCIRHPRHTEPRHRCQSFFSTATLPICSTSRGRPAPGANPRLSKRSRKAETAVMLSEGPTHIPNPRSHASTFPQLIAQKRACIKCLAVNLLTFFGAARLPARPPEAHSSPARFLGRERAGSPAYTVARSASPRRPAAGGGAVGRERGVLQGSLKRPAHGGTGRRGAEPLGGAVGG